MLAKQKNRAPTRLTQTLQSSETERWEDPVSHPTILEREHLNA
jgi:hypothetical protein